MTGVIHRCDGVETLDFHNIYNHHVFRVMPVTEMNSPCVENTNCKGTLILRRLDRPLSISAIGW